MNLEANFDNNQERQMLQQLASKKVAKLKSFYKFTFIYIIGLALFILKQYTDLSLYFFPVKFLNNIVMIIWTSVYISSAIDLFVSFKIFGKDWEERKLRSILEKKSRKQKWE